MDAAFNLAAPTPAARAQVFARLYRRGARDAANREIVFRDERMARQCEGIEIVKDLARRTSARAG